MYQGVEPLNLTNSLQGGQAHSSTVPGCMNEGVGYGRCPKPPAYGLSKHDLKFLCELAVVPRHPGMVTDNPNRKLVDRMDLLSTGYREPVDLSEASDEAGHSQIRHCRVEACP